MNASVETEIRNPVHRKRSPLAACVLAVGILTSLTIILLAGYWVWTLVWIPLIPEPMDVDRFVADLQVPDQENAINDYLHAASLLKEPDWRKHPPLEHDDITRWEDYPDHIKQFVENSRPAFNVWLGGTAKTRASAFDPLRPGANSNFDISQNVRRLSRPIAWRAAQLQHEGKLDEAWKYLAGALQTSAHLAQGGQMSARLVGSAFYAVFCTYSQRWAEDPQVSADQLRRALADLDRITAAIPPISHTIKAEYLTYRDLAAYWRNHSLLSTPRNNIQNFGLSRLADSSNRLQRHVIRNILSQCDLPRSKRNWQGDTQLFLDLHPTGPELPSHRIAELGEQNFMYSLIAPTYGTIVEISDRDLMRHSALRLVFALQLHFREHRKFPTTLEALVPEYLSELPPNPYAPLGQTLHYRAEADHVRLWNQGDDFDVQPQDGHQWSDPQDNSRVFWTIYPPGTRPPLYRELPPGETSEATGK